MAHLLDDDVALIRKVAEMMMAGQPASGDIASVLEAQMIYLAEARPSSGGAGSIMWIGGLRAFGEMLVSLSKREERRLKHYGL